MSAGKIAGWREERWNRIEVVRRFVSELTEKDMVLVAMLMMRGVPNEKIMKDLKMDEERFFIAREKLAFGLLFAGIAVRN